MAEQTTSSSSSPSSLSAPLPPFFHGQNVNKFNTATLSALTPVVELPIEPLKDGRPRIIRGLLPALHQSEVHGVLMPLERMPFVAPSFRRMKMAVDYSRVVSLPVDEYERPLTEAADPTPTDNEDTKSKDNDAASTSHLKQAPFIFLPSENPSLLHRHIRAIINAAFNYENWYYVMKGITIKDRSTGEDYDPLPLARFLPLPNEILSILHQLGTKVYFAHRTMRSYEFTAEEQELRKRLGAYFHQHMFGGDDSNENKKQFYFFKLSNKSPKDVVMHLFRPVNSGDEVAQRLIASSRALSGIRPAMGKKMGVDEGSSGEEKDDPDAINPDPGHLLQLVLMPWDNSIVSSLEFRCFVHNRRLCAVSQYDVTISSLLQVPERLRLFKQLIEDFYQQMLPCIPFGSCVMDVVVKPADAAVLTFETADYDPDSSLSAPDSVDLRPWLGDDKERWRVHLLEFNPFYAEGTSGTSLFDWKREFSIIYNGFKGTTDEQGEPIVPLTDNQQEWKTVLRYRIHDPNKGYRPLETPRNPRVRDVV